MNDIKIDLVYLWVDGNDIQWKQRRNKYLPQDEQQDPETFCEGRFFDNEELKYSLRSVEMYAPWINHIYIVTDNQTPKWLDIKNEKVTIVDHSSIFPKDKLPTYNSYAIEVCIVNIPGLSEYFLYANDDMMFNKSVSKDFFFTKDNYPIFRFAYSGRIYRLLKRILGNTPSLIVSSEKSILAANEIISNDFKVDYYHFYNIHQIDAYRKSSIIKCISRYKKNIDVILNNRFRGEGDIHRQLFALHAVMIGEGSIKAVSLLMNKVIRTLPLLRRLLRLEYHVVQIQETNNLKEIKSLRPKLVCFNDNQFANDQDRLRMKTEFNILYPNKSMFEI